MKLYIKSKEHKEELIKVFRDRFPQLDIQDSDEGLHLYFEEESLKANYEEFLSVISDMVKNLYIDYMMGLSRFSIDSKFYCINFNTLIEGQNFGLSDVFYDNFGELDLYFKIIKGDRLFMINVIVSDAFEDTPSTDSYSKIVDICTLEGKKLMSQEMSVINRENGLSYLAICERTHPIQMILQSKDGEKGVLKILNDEFKKLFLKVVINE